MKRILFTVSNDIRHDRRMIRICSALQHAGYQVTLVGRQYPDSPALPEYPFKVHRLSFWFRSGKLFYLEMQLRYLLCLWRQPAEAQCAIDLDTILPIVISGRMKRRRLIFDAHEFFTEVPELTGRPVSRAIWERIERWSVPYMDLIYTVGPALADVLAKRYARPVHVIRNLPDRQVEGDQWPARDRQIIWYQGALNQGRGLEVAIRVLARLPGYQLWIAGEGDLSEELRNLANTCGVHQQVRFLGWVPPAELSQWTVQASIGLNLLTDDSLSYYYSLANKWFDYVYARLPAIHMAFPEYVRLNDRYPVGVLIDQLDEDHLIQGIKELSDPETYRSCQAGCVVHTKELTWEREVVELLQHYASLF